MGGLSKRNRVYHNWFENRRRCIIPGSISIEDIERVIGLKLKIKKKPQRTRNVIKALCTGDLLLKVMAQFIKGFLKKGLLLFLDKIESTL
jgi:hypothetical protein